MKARKLTHWYHIRNKSSRKRSQLTTVFFNDRERLIWAQAKYDKTLLEYLLVDGPVSVGAASDKQSK